MIRGAALFVAVLVVIGGAGVTVGTAAVGSSTDVDSNAPGQVEGSETAVSNATGADTANDDDTDGLPGSGVAVALAAIVFAALIERFAN